MRARLLITAVLCSAAAGLASAGEAATPSTAVGIGEREFSIAVYRRTVPPGEVRFNIRNFGEDAHNLVVLGRTGRPLAQSAEIRAGRRATLAVNLRRTGTYRLICTAADHTSRGMTAKLVVRKPSRRLR
jgi:plastocyanin